MGSPLCGLCCDFMISGLRWNKVRLNLSSCGAQPSLKATGIGVWELLGAEQGGKGERAQTGGLRLGHHSPLFTCFRAPLAQAFSLDAVSSAVPGLSGGRCADLVGDVRQPCKLHTPKVSRPLALRFQPQASADEGLGPCGPFARGELT